MKKSVGITVALVLVGAATCGRLCAEPAPTMYVDGNVAASGNGLSWETAFKTIQESVTPSDVDTHRLILIRGDQQYEVSAVAGISLDRGGAGASARKTWRGVPGTNGMGRLPIVSGAFTHDGAAFSSTGTHDKVFWISYAPTYLFHLWTGPLGGEWGYDWNLYSKQSNVDDVQNTPSSWSWDGATLFVHTATSTHPSNFLVKTTSVNNCMQVKQSNISVENLELRHSRYSALKIMNSTYTHVMFRSNIVHHTGENGLDALQATSYTEFIDNTLFALPQIGIYTVAGSEHITVAGNHIDDSAVGIWANGSDVAIHGNRVSGSTSRAVQLNGDAISVYNNLFHDNSGYAVRAFTPNVAVYNNTFYNNGAYELYFESQVTNGIAFNNVIWTMILGSRGIQVHASATGIQSDYNDLYATGGAHVGQWAGLNRTTLADWQTASGQDANSLSADPRFLDAASGDFRLTGASPCFDAGTSAFAGTDAPSVDFAGAARPVSVRHDMGAYEYQPTGTTILIQ